jgi:hypothetical protein
MAASSAAMTMKRPSRAGETRALSKNSKPALNSAGLPI